MVILKSEFSEQAPELTVRLNHVVDVRFPGWYDSVVAVSPVKFTLSVDDAHEYVKVPNPPAGVPERRPGVVPVHNVSWPRGGRSMV